jgi:carbonic anhydrase
VAERPGYRRALVETSVAVNAAYAAYSLVEELPTSRRGEVRVVCGVYDLATRRVRPGDAEVIGLADPPAGLAEFRAFVAAAAARALPAD